MRVASAKEEGESGGSGIAGRIKRYFISQSDLYLKLR